MSAFVDNLNLRPQEKRILVGLGVAIFIVLNFVFVFPHFHDWGNIRKELDSTRLTITNYSQKINQDTNPVGGLKAQVAILEKQQQGGIQTHETEIALNQSVTAEARACGFVPQSISPASITKIGAASQSDKYFVSQSVRVAIQSSEDSLVKFLYDMGNDPAMIRVFDLTLSPADPNTRYQLRANITLTADYQKTVDTNAPLPKPITPAPKPAVTVPAPRVTPSAPNGARATAAKTNAAPGPARRGPPSLPSPPPIRPRAAPGNT